MDSSLELLSLSASAPARRGADAAAAAEDACGALVDFRVDVVDDRWPEDGACLDDPLLAGVGFARLALALAAPPSPVPPLLFSG